MDNERAIQILEEIIADLQKNSNVVDMELEEKFGGLKTIALSWWSDQRLLEKILSDEKRNS